MKNNSADGIIEVVVESGEGFTPKSEVAVDGVESA
jgi:hypothetical protein